MTNSKRIYFDYGCFGPMDKDVQDAVLAWIRCQNEHGPRAKRPLTYFFEGSDTPKFAHWPGLDNGLDYLSEALSVPPQSILTTQNTTTAILESIELLARQATNPVVILPCAEHPVIKHSVSQLCERLSINIEHIGSRHDGGRFDYEQTVNQIAAVADAGNAILVLSHVLWDTGEIVDLDRAICSHDNLAVVIDGAHAFGQIELDGIPWNKISSYCTCGHKWLRGPISLGLLLIRNEGIRSQYLDSYNVSFLTYPFGTQIDEDRFFASVPIEKFVGTALAARNLNQVGIACVRDKTVSLRHQLVDRIHDQFYTPIPDEVASGIVAINVGSTERAKEIVTILDSKYRLMVSETTPGSIRVCLTSTLLPEHVDRLTSALCELGMTKDSNQSRLFA